MEAQFDADYVFRLHRGLLPRNHFAAGGAETSERTEVVGADAYLITSDDDYESWFYHIDVFTEGNRTSFHAVVSRLSFTNDWWRWSLAREGMENLQAAGYGCSMNGALLNALIASLEDVRRHGCSPGDGMNDDPPF